MSPSWPKWIARLDRPRWSHTWASSFNRAWLELPTQVTPFDGFGHDTGGIGAVQRGNPDGQP